MSTKISPPEEAELFGLSFMPITSPPEPGVAEGAGMVMMRQAAAMRAAWHNLHDLESIPAIHLLRAWINLRQRAADAMLESMNPIGWS